MKIVIHTDIAEFEETLPIVERRGFKGYPYALVHTDEGTREIKAHNGMGNLFNTLKDLVIKDAKAKFLARGGKLPEWEQ